MGHRQSYAKFRENLFRSNEIIFKFFFVPYFFGYKTVFFSFQNNPKVLDPSFKTDLELWHCLGRVELGL